MVWPSNFTAQVIYQQQQAAAMTMQQAAAMSGSMGLMPQLSLGSTEPGTSGAYGEQLAMRTVGAGRTAAGIGALGLGVLGSMTGLPLDPMSGGIMGARAAFGAARMGGMGMFGAGAMGAVGAAAGALPFYMMSQAAGVYTGAFTGGMTQQAALNSTLRSNFNFQGGQGAYGRGFSQQQMGVIGQNISQELRSNPFTTSQELNNLISQGAEGGMFTAVRDVQQFSQRFRTMLEGLKKIQKELGGTLADAMAFSRGSSQLGVFSSAGRSALAAEFRDTQATTGLSQDQLFGLAAQGSMLSRATGGLGRQGAVGALRAARTLGAAVSSGVVNAEQLSEATGGLTGTDALQAFTGRILQQSERFSRRAMGRYSIFALSNERGTGLDQAMTDRFLAGDISTSSVMQDAHRTVNKMGRARAINQEGRLRGALLEQGGLAGQIGMMKLMVGDRVMDQSDDLASLVLQRRFGMQRPEAEVMMNLMRNQGSIAQTELADKRMGRRQTALQQDITENRSLDAFMVHLQHGLQDATGVTRVREMGRTFLTRVSSLAERALNDMLGVSASTLTQKDQHAMQRLAMGTASREDLARLDFGRGGRSGGAGGADPFQDTLASRVLHTLGAHGPETVGATMGKRGVDLRKMSARERDMAYAAAEMAQDGVVRGTDAKDLSTLMKDPGFMEKLTKARLVGALGGDASAVYRGFEGVSANAVDAAISRKGLAKTGVVPNVASLEGESTNALLNSLGSLRSAGGAGAAFGGTVGGLLGMVAGGLGGVAMSASEALRTEQDKALSFVSRGGHLRRAAEDIAAGGKARHGLGREEAVALSSVLGKGVDTDAMREVLNGETFQASLRRMSNMSGDTRALKAELGVLAEEANKLDPKSAQGKAALLAVREMQYNVEKDKSIGKEYGSAVRSTRRDEEMRRLYNATGAQYAKAAQAMEGLGLQSSVSAIGDAFYAHDGAGVNDKISALRTELARLPPDSEEYRKVAEALGGTEETRGLLIGAAHQRNTVKQLTGKGRRGRAAQAESALGLLTGGALSEMEFSVGGRQLSSRNQAQVLFEKFRTGGAGADELEKQLMTRMSELGVKDASEKVKEFRTLVGGGLDATEATKMYDKYANDGDLRRVREEALKRQQQAQNPLDTARNSLLEGIKLGIDRLVEKTAPEGVDSKT